MNIHATQLIKVEINPKDVIQKLIEEKIGYKGWIFYEEGKFYKGFEQSAGSHSFDDKEEITPQDYDYVKALELVLSRLK